MRTTKIESQIEQESVILLRPLVRETKLPYLAGFTSDGVLQIRFEDEELRTDRILKETLIDQKNYDLIFIRLLS